MKKLLLAAVLMTTLFSCKKGFENEIPSCGVITSVGVGNVSGSKMYLLTVDYNGKILSTLEPYDELSSYNEGDTYCK